MTALKLVALDEEDLRIMSAHLQDAVVRVGDMAYLPKERRFVVLLNRFDWVRAGEQDGANSGPGERYRRLRSALRIEHVKAARTQGVPQQAKREVLSLLTVVFEVARAGEPDGFVTLQFAGGGAVRLEVECVEAVLDDLGPGWRTTSKPEHPERK